MISITNTTTTKPHHLTFEFSSSNIELAPILNQFSFDTSSKKLVMDKAPLFLEPQIELDKPKDLFSLDLFSSPMMAILSSKSTNIKNLIQSIPQIDQQLFLTKNSHIKRPRNAWIHFRCHYGQSLKIQDPTLRAEEISKRASNRWSQLTKTEKKPWHELAEQEKLAHREAFPEYRYCPRRQRSDDTQHKTLKKLKTI